MRHARLEHARPKPLWLACALALFACVLTPRGDASGPNFALDRPATGSPICKPGEEVEKAFDGRAESWTQDKFCTLETPSWLQVDLGEVRTIRSFTVKHAGAAGEAKAMNTRAFRIRTSLDGEAWATAVDVTDNAGDVTVHDISPCEARYVRLDVTEPTQDPGDRATRIYELQVR